MRAEASFQEIMVNWSRAEGNYKDDVHWQKQGRGNQNLLRSSYFHFFLFRMIGFKEAYKKVIIMPKEVKYNTIHLNSY